MVVANREGHFAVPVAFLYTLDSNNMALSAWVDALFKFLEQKTGITYEPNAVIMDQGAAEFRTIRAIFPQARIFFCDFHVLMSVGKGVLDHMTRTAPKGEELVPLTNDNKATIRQLVVKDVSSKRLMNCTV